MNAANAIAEMQAIWVRVTAQTVHPRLTERLFFEAWRMEITPDDLRCVLEYMQRYNRENAGGAQFRINVQKILGDLETFASTLAEARAKERNRRPPPTAKQQVEALRERPVDAEQSSTLGGASSTSPKLGDSPDFKALLQKIGNTEPAKPTGGK